MSEIAADRYDKNNNFAAYQEEISKRAEYTAESIANETKRLSELQQQLTSGNIRRGTPAWDELNDNIREAQESIEQYTLNYEDLVRLSQQSKLEHIAEQFNNADAERQHNLKMIQYQETKYQNAGELSNYGYMLGVEVSARKEELQYQKEYAQQLKDTLAATDESSDAYEKYSQEYYKVCEAIKATENELESLEKKQKDNSLAILKIRKSVEDTINDEIKTRIQKEKNMLSATIQIENQLASIIRKRYTDELALMRKRDEQNKESLNNEKNLLNERLEYKKKAIDYANKYEELAEYKKQLAILRMDSTRTKEALELERKITDLQRELSLQEESDYVAARNEQIDEEIKAIDEAATKREETTNEWLKDYANIADQIESIMAGGEGSYLEALKEQDEWKYASEEQRKQMEQEAHDRWLASIGEIETYWDEVLEHISSKDDFIDYMVNSDKYKYDSEAGQAIFMRQMEDLYDNLISAEKVDPVFEHIDDIKGTVTDMSAMLSGKMNELITIVQNIWDGQQIAEWTDYRPDMNIGSMDLPTHVASQEAYNFDPNLILNSINGLIQDATNRYADYVAEQQRQAQAAAAAATASSPSYSSKTNKKNPAVTGAVTGATETLRLVTVVGGTGSSPGATTSYYVSAKNDEDYKKKAQLLAKSKGGTIKKNAEGGLIDYTGLAWVDGSLTKPESFLDATDTKLLRSMLDAFSYVNVNTGFIPSSEMMTSNNTTIGDINITINQAELKSDADVDSLARKIGKSFTKELGKQGFNLPSYSF